MTSCPVCDGGGGCDPPVNKEAGGTAGMPEEASNTPLPSGGKI